jgi:hypothetical protein
MDSIVKNIQFNMRLILIGCLLIAFPLFYTPPDIIGIGVATLNQVVRLSHHWRGDLFDVFDREISQQLEQYHRGLHSEDAPLTLESQRFLVSEMRVDQIVKLRSFITPRELSLQDIVIPSDREYPVNIDVLRRSLSQINDVYQETLYPQSATFLQLSESIRGRVTVPVIGRTVYIEDALLIIAAALIFVFLYLISLVGALMAAVKREEESDAMEFIWFHPGWLGITLGILWLAAPAIIFIFSVLRSVIPNVLGLSAAIVFFTMGLITTVKLINVRKKVLVHLAVDRK